MWRNWPWGTAPAGDPAAGVNRRRSGELRLPSYDLFSSTEVLGRMALEKMIAAAKPSRASGGPAR